MKAVLEKLFDFLASLRLAVIVIVSLAVVSSVGTIIEAQYDAQVAQKLVYRSIYMYAVMILLALNLTAVMIDRWPWRRHHVAFVLAHIGIILLLVGSVITNKIGLDGSMAFEIGQANRYVTVDETEFAVYSSFGDGNFSRLFSQPVDFFLNPPQKHPLVVPLGQDSLEVVDYYHYAIRQSEISPSPERADGSAIRIQLQNANVNLSQWLFRESRRPVVESNLGPAKVVWSDGSYRYEKGNVLVLSPEKSPDRVRFQVYTQSRGGLSSQGVLREGDVTDVGWMDFKLRLLRILPQAREKVTYIRKDKPSPMTKAAVKVRSRGEEHWLGLNSVLKLFANDHMLMVTFANRRIDLGFDIKLTRFHVGHYEGTMRAASYESDVDVEGMGPANISMNEPLKYRGLTFYQASFEQDESGKPVASILSVNRDPGRFLKYLGSLLIVVGAIMLFYFKNWYMAKWNRSDVKESP